MLMNMQCSDVPESGDQFQVHTLQILILWSNNSYLVDFSKNKHPYGNLHFPNSS